MYLYGRSKTLRINSRKCWKCGKDKHDKKGHISKNVDKGKNRWHSFLKMEGLLRGRSECVIGFFKHTFRSWCVAHRLKFDVFLQDDSITRIIGHGRVKLLHKDGRIRTLPEDLHNPMLDRSLKIMSKMSDENVHTMFENKTYNMIRGEMVLMRGV